MFAPPVQKPQTSPASRWSAKPQPTSSKPRFTPQTAGVQAKLRVASAHDPLEQQADHLARHVLAMPQPPFAPPAIPPQVQRSPAHPPGRLDAAAPEAMTRLPAASGKPLEPSLRQDMEQRFGYDFSRVRIHADAAATRSAQQIDARAYTAGHHIVFNALQFQPGTSDGRFLLAHELTHVVQQQQAQPAAPQGYFRPRRSADPVSPAPTNAVQRSPNAGASSDTESAADLPYPEEHNVLAVAVGQLKLGRITPGGVFFGTKDWTATGMANNAFYVGPFFSDMGHFYYVYRFTSADQNTTSYTLSRGTYLPAAHEQDVTKGVEQVHGGTIVSIQTPGQSPATDIAKTKEVKMPDIKSTKPSQQAPGSQPTTGSQPPAAPQPGAPAQPSEILPEFADKTEAQCQQVVGDIYGGRGNEAEKGIINHKLDAVQAMEQILDKTDSAISKDALLFFSIVIGAAAGALGAGLPYIVANALVWGAAGAAGAALSSFSNDNVIDAIEFCEDYKLHLRLSLDVAISRVQSKLVGDLNDVRRAASAFRTLVRDASQIQRIKLNQQQEVLDLWTNSVLAEKERKKGGKIKGPSDPGSRDFGANTMGQLFLDIARLGAEEPPTRHPFRWIASPRSAYMPGVNEQARQKNLDRRITDVAVVRHMRVGTGINQPFRVSMAPDGTESASSMVSDDSTMQWILASFLLNRAIDPNPEESERLIDANWKLGISKVWDQVRNKTFAELGVAQIQGDSKDLHLWQ